MKANFLLQGRFALLLMVLLGCAEMAKAQGPTIDPTFQVTSVFKPATISQAFQQPDGKRLLLSNAIRVGNSPTTGLLRLLAGSDLPDLAFQTNVGSLSGDYSFINLLPNGKILLVSRGTLMLNGVTRQGLLRLNADGSPDTSFDTGSNVGTGTINAILGQPDGKLLVAGHFYDFNGQPAAGIVRLNTDGNIDAAFQSALGRGISIAAGNEVTAVALQTDGKVLLAGSFSSVNGVARQSVARLLASGAIDTGFVMLLPPLYSSISFSGVAVQPDGKILLSSSVTSSPTWPPLTRLEATGAIDAAFQTGTGFSSPFQNTFSYPPVYYQPVVVQPDGKLLVTTAAATFNGTPIGHLVRLLPSGGLDPDFANATAAPGPNVTAVQVLPTGQLLVATAGLTQYGPTGSASVALLDSNGSRDQSFAPVFRARALVRDVVQQADGKYVVGGNFTEINGVAAGYLARLNADGMVDTAFTAAAQASGEVMALAEQPDGKVLVGGVFEHLAGGNRVALGRLLPTGALDTGFVPTLIQTTYSLIPTSVLRIACHPDGRVLITGYIREGSLPNITAINSLFCLNGITGQLDASVPHYYTVDILAQPDGKVLLAGQMLVNGRYSTIFRMLASGALDPSFVATETFSNTGTQATSLARDATGRIYAGGQFSQFGGLPFAKAIRLLADGTPDPGFSASGTAANSAVLALAVQPNGRLLVGGQLDAIGTLGITRLLPTGAPDASYTSINGPTATVYRLLVQPDGAIMAAGDFTRVGGQPITGLVRLLDANVLSVSSQQLAARTQAWPVPAHGQLHLALDAASRPQRVDLLDGLGRVALSQATSQTELTLDTTPLAAGVYVLRVQYASGPVSRRVMVE